jgi:hypothetical protein
MPAPGDVRFVVTRIEETNRFGIAGDASPAGVGQPLWRPPKRVRAAVATGRQADELTLACSPSSRPATSSDVAETRVIHGLHRESP